MIRTLKHDEIECRVQQVKSNGCALLLYKDARCDMKILDETFGVYGWEREHQLINGNLFCTVRVLDKENSRWISKQDVGTESNAEKEKGQASDSFKRACFNLGIGRELYTAPFIWIKLEPKELNGTRLAYGVDFSVKEIGYNDKREINKLIIVDKNNKIRFTYKKEEPKKTELIGSVEIDKLLNLIAAKGLTKEKVSSQIKKGFNKNIEQLTKEEFKKVLSVYKDYKTN